MCPKFSVLYFEGLQTEKGGTGGWVGMVVVVMSAHVQASAHYLRQTKIPDKVVFLLNYHFHHNFIKTHWS